MAYHIYEHTFQVRPVEQSLEGVCVGRIDEALYIESLFCSLNLLESKVVQTKATYIMSCIVSSMHLSELYILKN